MSLSSFSCTQSNGSKYCNVSLTIQLDLFVYSQIVKQFYIFNTSLKAKQFYLIEESRE